MKKIIYSVIMLAVAAFTLTSCEDVPAPYGFPEESGGKEEIPTVDPEGTGAKDDPYNVSAALSLVKAMADGEATPTIYVKGIISAIDAVEPDFGNATYYISDDGTTNNQLEVYRGKYLAGASFTSADQIKVGDEVIVAGVCKNFRGTTPEFDAGSAIVMLNGENYPLPELAEPEGTGVKEDPYNVAAALTRIRPMADGETTDNIYVKGKISRIDEINLQNGNATYFISDDGTDGNELEVYRGLYLGGVKFTDGDQIKAGDEVIITGKCKNFKGNTPEFDSGNYIYSLNGQTAEKSKPNTKFDPVGTGTEEDPYNVAAVLQNFYDLENGKNTDDFVVKGIVVGTPEINTGDYGNANYYISDDGTEDDKLYIFRGLDLDKQKFTDGAKIKAGDVVVIKGHLTNYGGTLELAQDNYLLSINNGQSITKVVEGNTVTFTDGSLTADNSFADEIYFNRQQWANQQKEGLTVYTNMASVTFEQGEGSNPPAYYESTSGVRMYAKNLLNVGGGNLKVAKIVLTCESETYVGNSQLYAKADGTTMTICNDFTSTRGGTQLRVQKIEIVYAK